MKIAILTSGILPVPAVQGGAVETLVDHYLEYNDKHKLHDITVFSVYHPKINNNPMLQSDVNHYRYIDVSSLWAKVRKHIHGFLHRHTYYHYSIDYYFCQALKDISRQELDLIILENRPAYALQLRGMTNARLVYHLHNDYLNSNMLQGNEIYQSAVRILTVSDYIRHRVATCNEQDEKTITVHNGIDLDAFKHPSAITREQIGCKADDFILVFSGRLIPEKGIMELVEAMKMLKEQPRIKLLVIGSSFFDNSQKDDAFISELRSIASEIGDRIVFTSYVEHERIPDYLKLADVAVIPSTWNDPFPTTVLEGMAAGLPIITTYRGGIPEMVTKDNVIFILVESYMSFTSDMKVNGREVTPFLNSLKRDSTVYYNGRMKENVTIGESSDGQFIYMAGLLPLRSVITVSKARNATLCGLPKILGRESRMVIPTVSSLWNQDEMCRQYGFKHLYASSDYAGGDYSNLNDEQVFLLATQKDKESTSPFFSVILTMTMHQPYTEQIDPTFSITDVSIPKDLACYLNACHYTDRQIELYFNHLKRYSLYDNSLIVIAADHPVHNTDFGGVSKDIPLFLVNIPLEIKSRMWVGECNQIDVYSWSTSRKAATGRNMATGF